MQYSLPAHAGRNYAQRFVDNFIPLIHHEEVCVPLLRLQALFSVLNCPPQLLHSHEYLTQTSIHHSLARVEAGNPCNDLLIFEDKLEHCTQHLAALAKACLCPFHLGVFGFGDCTVDTVCGGGVDAPEGFTSCGGVALD